MANIMLYGFGSDKKAAKNLVQKIKEIMATKYPDSELLNETVVTTVNSDVLVFGTAVTRRYVRICSTSEDEMNKVVEILCAAKIGLDVELLLVDSFISYVSMK